MGKKKDKTPKNQEEEVPEETSEEKPQKKKEKRKSAAERSTVEPAQKKSKQDPADDNDDAEQPTATIGAGTTIEQALLVNPALKLNKATKRGKKREKHAKNQEAKQEKAKDREKEEVKQYLSSWNDDREKWKFQKLKQIYIQEHVFDEQMLDGDIWPVVLEYLSGMKGPGRDNLSKQAQATIKELDRQAKDSGDESLLEGSKYQRARDLLQYLG